MKRDRSGKFVSYWHSEPKQAVNLSLTKTAWQILQQQARRRGLSRSELIERYARSLEQCSESSLSLEQNPRIRVSDAEIEWQLDQGTFTIGGFPAAFFWLDTTLASLMAAFQAMVGTERFALALQSEGRKSVALDWGIIAQYNSFPEGFAMLSKIAKVGGWGEMELLSIDWNQQTCHFRVRNSWEGRYQKTLGVCWGSGIIAGKLSGCCSRLFQRNCWSEQTAFIAKGDEWDEFTVKPSSRSIEEEIDQLLATDQATRADMAVALQKLQREIEQRKRIEAIQKQIEETLRQTEERLRLALQGADAIAWEFNLKTYQVFCSEKALEVWGIQVGSADDFFAIIHPEDRQNMIAAYQSALMGTDSYSQEYRVIRSDGATRWLNSQGKVYRDAQGQPERMIGVSIDITQHKRTEAALAESNQTLQAIIQACPLAITGLTSDGIVKLWNPAAELIFGWTQEEVLGRFLPCIPEHKREEFLTNISQTLEGQPLTGVEAQRQKKGGIPLDVALWSASMDEAKAQMSCLSVIADITDRKQTENAIRESEARFRLIAENSTDIISRHNANGVLLYISPACRTLLGYEPEDLIGTLSYELIHPDDLATWSQRFPEPDTQPDTYTFIHRGRHQQGHYIWLEAKVRVIRDAQTRAILETQASSRDITERKAVEERQRFLMQASEILFSSLDYETTLSHLARLIVPQLADCCIVDGIDEHHKIQRIAVAHADPAHHELVERLRQYPPSEEQIHSVVEVMRTGKSRLVAHIHDEDLKSVALDAEHFRILKALKPQSLMCIPLIVRGQILGAISLVSCRRHHTYELQDLAVAEELAHRAAIAINNALFYREAQHARQVAEQAADRTSCLQAVTAALSESLTPVQIADVIVEQGMAALGVTSGMVALVTASGTELEIVRFMGYDPKLVESWKRFSIDRAVPLAEAVRTGKPIWNESWQERIARYPHLESAYQRYNHQTWISLPLMVERRAVGGISFSFAETRHLNDEDKGFILAVAQQSAQAIQRARLYEAERTARAEAEAANRVKDEFLAIVSHELRTPLNSILGWSQMLLSRKFDGATLTRALETIERNARSQNQLINDLLDVSRMMRGKIRLNRCPVRLLSVLNLVLDSIRMNVEAQQIDLNLDFDQPEAMVLGDFERLQQIFWNLLSNALKFTPAGGKIEVSLQQVGSHVQVQVKDSGIGIKPDFLPYIFESFRQADGTTTRSHGGLGLGLAIVRHLVKLHDGTVEADSLGEGQGATFTVKLPLLVKSSASPEPSEPSVDQLPLLQGIQVLVIDDEADSREICSVVLDAQGATLVTAASAQEALMIITQSPPDILISDIGMPGMDGYALLRHLRSQGEQMPAIALTAYVGEAAQKQAQEAGFQLHLSKPLDPEALVRAIAHLLQE